MNLKLKSELSPVDLRERFRPFEETMIMITGERIISWGSYTPCEVDFEKIKFIELAPPSHQPVSIPGLEVVRERMTRDFFVSRLLGERGHPSLDSRVAEAIWENRQVLIPKIKATLQSRPPIMSLCDEVLIAFPGDLLVTDSGSCRVMTGIIIQGDNSRIGWVCVYLDHWFWRCWYDDSLPYRKVLFATL